MILSDRGLELIKHFESCQLTAYRDSGGVWTIGWGHTGQEVASGLTWTQEHADNVLITDVRDFEAGVTRLLKVRVTQNQFDALVSFAFNVGLDIDIDTKAEGLGDSTLLKKLNTGDTAGAAVEFEKWNKDNGQIVAGLTRRRRAERELFEEVV